METRARFVFMGIFFIVATIIGFGFVYWLNHSGGLRDRTLYRVEFQSPTTGLRTGSAVLFNGIRVGEVTALGLNPARPELVWATIAVDKETPVRTNTDVGIDVQGLMGSPTVALRGRNLIAPALSAPRGEIPVLAANPAATRDTMQSARETLRSIDKILNDNADSLHSTIENLNTFSAALARNSDRLDVIVDGLARMLGAPPKSPTKTRDLTAPREFASIAKVPSGQLIIPEPTTVDALDTSKILTQSVEGDSAFLPNEQWSDSLPKLFHARVIQAFENANFNGVSQTPEMLTADQQLIIDIRSFSISTTSPPLANVEFSAKIVQSGRVKASRIFRTSTPIAVGIDANSSVHALDAAFGTSVVELVNWTLVTL